MDINTRIGQRLRQLREAEGLSIEALATRSGVSRSSISLIERGGSSPTAVVLDKLSTALGATVAALFAAEAAPARNPSPLARVAEQPVWTDPASGYVRRQVSPALPGPLQLVDVVFPPGQRVAFDNAERGRDMHQQLWMIEGRMQLSVGATTWVLDAGDCLAMGLDEPIVFHNPGRQSARYLVALVSGRRVAPGR